MKILTLSTCPLDPMLGSGKTRLRWSTGLRELGHHVDVYEPKDFETWHGLRRGLRFRQAWGAVGFVKEKLRRFSYDLVEFFGGEFGLVTWYLSRQEDRPLIVAHTDGVEMLASDRELYFNGKAGMRRAVWGRWLRSQTHERLSKSAFVHADAFVAGCELDREYVLLHKLFQAENAAVVHPGLDQEYLAAPFVEHKENRIAFTGSWIPRKGVDVLIPVTTKVLHEKEDVKLDIFGSGWKAEDVLQRFPESIRSRISVYPRISSEQMADRLSKASVFFFPTNYEGFGMALAEAMSCSCAVVTTPTGFGAELNGGVEALLCEFNDIAAMTSSILKLLNNEDLRRRIALAGWKRVQELSWATNVKKLEDIYLRWLRVNASLVVEGECK